MIGPTLKVVKNFNPDLITNLKQRMKAATEKKVLVGLPAGREYPNGTPVALVGAVHQFGVPERGIPERPWLTDGLKLGIPKFRPMNRENLRLVMNGQMTVDHALGMLGQLATDEIKKDFFNNHWAPLAESTIRAYARRGSSQHTLLFDTGLMWNSISWLLSTEALK